MRPPFLFLPTGEKETGRLAVQRKRGVECRLGQNRAPIPCRATRSICSADLVRGGHCPASPTADALWVQNRCAMQSALVVLFAPRGRIQERGPKPPPWPVGMGFPKGKANRNAFPLACLLSLSARSERDRGPGRAGPEESNFVGTTKRNRDRGSPELEGLDYSSPSSSSSHNAATASDGMRQSPRGDRATDPTLGPSARHERLNCWEKKRR